MGSFSIFHWLIVLVFLAAPVVIVLSVVRATRRASPPRANVEQRLRQLAELKSQGLISESEFQQQRANIVARV